MRQIFVLAFCTPQSDSTNNLSGRSHGHSLQTFGWMRCVLDNLAGLDVHPGASENPTCGPNKQSLLYIALSQLLFGPAIRRFSVVVCILYIYMCVFLPPDTTSTILAVPRRGPN